MTKRTLIALAPSCLLLAACGGDGAGSPNTGAKDNDAAMVRFAQCMRKGGIDVADPEPGGGIRIRVNGKMNEARVQKLDNECREKSGVQEGPGPSAEQQKEIQEGALKFARCMRSKGVDMPDPQISGGRMTMKIRKSNLSQPRVQKAQEECQKLSPVGGPPPGGPSAEGGKVTSP